MWTFLLLACVAAKPDPRGVGRDTNGRPDADTAASEDDTWGEDTSGEDTSGRDTSGEDTSGRDTSGEDTSTAGDTGGTGTPGRRFEGGGEYTASADADATITGSVGYWVGAGDLDGDGRADLVTAEPTAATAWLYGALGRGETRSTADAFASVAGDPSVRLGTYGASPGDVTGDGADDLVLASAAGGGVVLAGPFAGAHAATDACCSFDVGIAFAGVDLDGDGARTLAVGDPDADGEAGVVYLLAAPLSGSVTLATDAAIRIEGEPGWRLGGAIANVGDLDGDGAEEIALLAPTSDLAGAARGAVFVFHDAPSGTLAVRDADVTVTPSTSTALGAPLAGPADLDADGYGDLVVTHGGAWVFAGPVAAGAYTEHDAIADVDAGCGAATPAPVDLDGDGADDLVIGCPSQSRSSWAWLHYGPLSGARDTSAADATFYDSGYYDRFGGAIVGADLDADGIDDLAFADGDTGGAGQAIYLFFGGL